jgi:hypothetical protein
MVKKNLTPNPVHCVRWVMSLPKWGKLLVVRQSRATGGFNPYNYLVYHENGAIAWQQTKDRTY